MASNYILTVAGSKGGVGKTTTSINLGSCFADAGYSSVVVEADLPMANLVDFIDLDIDEREAETLHDVLAGEVRVVDAVYEVDDCLAVVPSGTNPERYTSLSVDRLEPAIEHLWWHYDIIIIDTPAGVSDEVTESIGLADEVILVSTPRVSSVRNTRNTKAIVERIGTNIRGLVLSKSGTGKSPGAERIADFLDLDLLGHVPEDEAVPHSQDHGQPVVEHAPASGPAIAYNRIASKLLDTADIDVDPPQPESVTEDTPTEGNVNSTVVESPMFTPPPPERTVYRGADEESTDTERDTTANEGDVTAEDAPDSEAGGGTTTGDETLSGPEDESNGSETHYSEMAGPSGPGSEPETDPESEGDGVGEQTDDTTEEDIEDTFVARFRSVVGL